jgi:ribonuclease-3
MRKSNNFTREERNHLRQILQEKTGYCFRKNSGVLIQAFTRSSYTAMCGGENNEVLEFIGDQVMSYYLTRQIVARCGALNYAGEFSFRIRENRFTEIKQELVCNENLEQIIDQWGIAEYLVVGKAEATLPTKAKADLFEAILGAIALESNWNPEVLEASVVKMLDLDNRLAEMIASDFRPVRFDLDTAVTVLKELAERGECSAPIYDYSGPDALGYDKNGNPIWYVRCMAIDSITGIIRSVRASSKKDAKKAAAYLVLCEHFETQNQYGPNHFAAGWIYCDGRLVPDIPPYNEKYKII